MDDRETHTWMIFVATFTIIMLAVILYGITGGDVQPGWGGSAVIVSLVAGALVAWQYWNWTDQS